MQTAPGLCMYQTVAWSAWFSWTSCWKTTRAATLTMWPFLMAPQQSTRIWGTTVGVTSLLTPSPLQTNCLLFLSLTSILEGEDLRHITIQVSCRQDVGQYYYLG